MGTISSNSTTLTRGVQVIKRHLETMPSDPGVYRMLDDKGKALYVGKAKNLAKRVVNYTYPERLGYRIQAMISHTASMEIITTGSEAEALLLEANLIKKLEPRYNILLKDDKSYPYILITGDHDYPRIIKHRGAQKQKGTYYGPFASAGAVNAAIADLQKAFLIRPCTDHYFASRTRPCMEYQIKRCSAPCVNRITKNDYAALVSQTKAFMSGKNRQVQKQLLTEMETASIDEDYEKAAVFRDRIKALNHIQAKQSVHVASLTDADVIGMHQDNNALCVQVFFFRGGQNFGNKSFFPAHSEGLEAAEIMEMFIGQFYQSNPPPKEIILPYKPQGRQAIETALASLCGHKVSLNTPRQGDKKKLVSDANDNAKSALKQYLARHARQSEMLAAVGKLFGLPKTPERIEVYDNSHIMGRHEIGAMIVMGSDGFNKKAYRRFNIKGEARHRGDDYAMLREVLLRRFKRLKQECPQPQASIWPDLVLIDGGAGQLGIAKEVFAELELDTQIVFACISKGPDRHAGREQFHMPNREPFTLPHADPVMHYLQVMRDEAHHFAIGSHRKKRSAATFKSALDEVPGIGAKRKKQLLHHFGSVDDIRNATVDELTKVDGISDALAEQIYNFFKH